MMKDGVIRFDCMLYLVTKSAFNSGQVYSVTINDPYMVYMFHNDSTNGKFHGLVKVENGKLDYNGKAISIFQE
ncbi:rCG44793 [Rattus norvegicus]|uniref:RCG44793 n=1 Tax=Rattus norvegicus TaxID=10116 RepID=A6I4M5_RAT|nr:rCG44793 [Rattus norvegicus]